MLQISNYVPRQACSIDGTPRNSDKRRTVVASQASRYLQFVQLVF